MKTCVCVGVRARAPRACVRACVPVCESACVPVCVCLCVCVPVPACLCACVCVLCVCVCVSLPLPYRTEPLIGAGSTGGRLTIGCLTGVQYLTSDQDPSLA